MRFATVGLLVGLAILTLRDARDKTSGRLLIALCISLIGMMIARAPSIVEIPQAVKATAAAVELPNTVLAWLFIKSIMDDRFKLDWKHIIAAGIFVTGYAFLQIGSQEASPLADQKLWTLLNIYALGLFIHLAFLIVLDWRGDLIMQRRRARIVFVGLAIGLVSFLIVTELLLTDLGRPALNAMKVGVTLLLVMFGYLWFLNVRPGHLAFRGDPEPAEQLELSDRECRVADKLNTAMQVQQMWRSAELTISDVAREIGIGEHALRKFINTRLGYANFPRYLQTFRLAEAKARLRDQFQRDVTITAIAFESGFNSISTFNRVFKENEGVSPKAFRERELD